MPTIITRKQKDDLLDILDDILDAWGGNPEMSKEDRAREARMFRLRKALKKELGYQ